MSRPFRERNPVTIGAVGLAVIAVLLLAAFNAQDLPLIGAGKSLSAAFTDASGIKPGDEVRVAGVKVGKVTGVSLAGSHVVVDFKIQHGVVVGETPTASIRIKTILGQKFLAIAPAGPGDLKGGSQIPLSRTATPFDVVAAFNGLATTVGQINSQQLGQAFDTMASTFRDSPPEVKAALQGLSRLSTTIASRDAELRQLLQRANGVTAVLAQRDQEFTKLISDGNLLLQEVQARRDAIHQLLVSTSQLSLQLSALISENQAQLQPALQQLSGVLGVLQKNQANLDKAIGLLSPFVRIFTNVLGTGRWFDTYVACLGNVVAGTPLVATSQGCAAP